MLLDWRAWGGVERGGQRRALGVGVALRLPTASVISPPCDILADDIDVRCFL